ncbi:complement C1q-like protein 2 [Sardina pilchardus]|uniref:complement C1q-like protein 2 n=1 Tax=Sardina pilchardus TaxID=27697 RepID=UPI002E11FF1F
MKTCGSVLLLLWAALVVVAGESTDQPTINTCTQQTCQPNFDTVMREMSTVMAEQRVELRYTKTQMEAMEKKAETMDARLRASEKAVEEQRALIQELQEKQEEQAAAVRAVGGSVNITGSQVEELRREREQRRVSFSASLVASGSVTTGPFNTDTTLVYRHIYTNIGNAYNPNTGIFTAPVRGIYHFYFALHGHGHASVPNAISLRKNGELIVYAWCQQASYSVNPSNGVSLLLEVGDVVYLQLRHGARVFDNTNRHTTFLGHLLFTV